jgi:adenylylsulfate kinase
MSHIYWFTGQSGHGKTHNAKFLQKVLISNGYQAIHIDGDDIREIFNNKDYSETGRRKNIELAQNIAHFLQTKKFDVVVSLVSPYKDQRDLFKEKMGNNIIEIYTHTDEVRGRESYEVPDYQPPTENFVDLDTTNRELRENIKIIYEYEQKQYEQELHSQIGQENI